MSTIEIKNGSFSYGDIQALRDVNGILRPNRLTCIVGPNGSGKTTLLSVIAGLLGDGKNVFINDESLAKLTPHARAKKIAYVAQDAQMSFGFSVRDVVLMGRYPYLKRFADETQADIQIAEKAMKDTDVWEFRNRSVLELSGGERQRVMVARALAQQTPILLLDEPIANLDIRYQVQLLSLLKKQVVENGLTVACVLHDLNLAAAYADDVWLMQKGQLIANGSVEEVFKQEILSNVYGLKLFCGLHALTKEIIIAPHYH